MLESTEVKNRRIMRNTLFLYIRTFFTMIVSLYTSRVVLRQLGIDDYGVYNVVGGFVSMFYIIVGPISNAISRFLTFELGKGNLNRLKDTFSTSVNVQLLLGLIVILIGETFGMWFLNNKLNIPESSMIAANWVLQCSILSMVIGLINVPYYSSIVAHEKMDAFAYVSIVEVILKLLLALSLLKIATNKLIFYSVGIVLIGLVMRLIYSVYCSRKFEECHYELKFDIATFKTMFGFAWWSFLGNTAYVFNTQGISMLMNIYFGIILNTAKGIAMQVEGAVMTFVNSFTTAFNPQITKSYAENNREYMYSIMCRGSKFSYFLLLMLIIPIEFETPIILRLWLSESPEYSISFMRLTLINSATMLLGSPFLQGILATGNIKYYQIAVTIIGLCVFPISWIAYWKGCPPEIYFLISIVIYNLLIWVRMWFIKKLLGFKIRLFFENVFIPIIRCTIIAVIPTFIIWLFMRDGYLRLITITIVNFVTTPLIVYFWGMTKGERGYTTAKLESIYKRI